MKKFGLIGLMLLVVLVTPVMAATVFIEPNKTTVAPGEVFAVDISVQDGTAQSVLVNFTFDTSKISYVSGSTQGLFNTMDTISSTANYVRYLGVSSSPVSIASKTKVATAVFQVNSGASGSISFNVVTASVNAVDAAPVVVNLQIQAQPGPGPGPQPGAEYFQRDMTFTDTTTGASITIKNVPLIVDQQGQWVLNYYGEDIQLDYSGIGATTVDIRIYKASTGELVKIYTNSKTIPATDIVPGETYRLVISWYDNNGIIIDQIDLSNANTFNSLVIKDIGAVNRAPALIQFVAVLTKPIPSISVDQTPTVFGDRIVFKVSISNWQQGMRWTWNVQGPYYGEVLRSLNPLTTSSSDIVLDTGDLKINREAQAGLYTFVALVLDNANRPLNYASVNFEIRDPDLEIVYPTDSKIGNKIRVIATTNVADTNSKYDIGVPNSADIRVYDSNGNTIYQATTVPVKDGKIESPVTILLHPSLPTGTYRVEVTVTTYNGIQESKVKYFNVLDATVEFNMPLNYVRGEEIQFKGTTSLFTEQPPARTNYMWVFIVPDPPLGIDAQIWDNLIEEFNLANVQTIGNNINVITNEGFFRIGDRIGLLAVVTADRTFKTADDRFHINSNADFISYTFRGIVAYWVGPENNGQMVLSDYSGSVTIKVVKEKITLNIEPSVAAKGMYVKISGVAPREDDQVYIFTSDPNVFQNVPMIPSEDNPFNRPVGVFVINTDSKGAFSTLVRVNMNVEADTYIVYAIQPSDRTGNVFDPTVDPLGMATITIREFGFIEVPEVFEIVQGDSKDFVVKVFGDPDNLDVRMTLKGHGVTVRDIVLAKVNESSDGLSGYMYTTLYTFCTRQQPRTLTDTFVDFDRTIVLKPGTSYTLTLDMENLQTGETVDSVTVVLTVKRAEMDVQMPSQIVAGDKLVIKIDTNHESKGYDDIHVIVDLGTGLLRKYLFVPLNDKGDATVEIDTVGWEAGKTVTVWIRDRVKTQIGWDWNQHYDYSPVGKEEVDYSALKNIAANDDVVVKRPVEVLKTAPVTTPPATTPPATTPVTTPPATTPVTTPPATTPHATTTPAPGPIPGFEAIFAIAGLLAVAYFLRKKQ